MKIAFYDVETYPNFLSLLFLDFTTPIELISQYIDIDIKLKQAIKNSPELCDEIYAQKLNILSQINYRKFIVYTEHFSNKVQINDIHSFYDFISNIHLLIGFNSLKFDNLIIDLLILGKDIYNDPNNDWRINLDVYSLVEAIIRNNHLNYKYLDPTLSAFQEPYKSIDLFAGLLETVDRKSLKQIGIILKWYRIEDLPIKPGSIIKFDQIADIIDYNFNDVLLTRHMYFNQEDELRLKFDIGTEYNLNLLSANRSKIAEKLLTKFYSEATGMKPYQFRDKRTVRSTVKFGDILNPVINFKTPILKQLHDKLKNTIYIVGLDDNTEKSKFGELVLFKDKGYRLGVGGLHSVDRPYLYKINSDTHIMRDADVTSYYPNLVLNEQVCPAHIAPVAFNQIVKTVVIKRTDAKNLSKKYKGVDPILYKKYSTEADGLKIVANSGLFGFFGSGDKWLFDIKCTYQTTLNGQLYLLMLIEELEENGIEVISANTDGIVCKFPIYLESLYNQICVNWQKLTNLNLEYTDYYKYVRTSVNDYIAIKTSYLNSGNREDVKLKGDFISTPSIKKGYNAPIVALALDKYYVENISYEETIRNHLDIYDFCIGVKTGENYVKSLHSLKDNVLNIEELSKNLRYFVSNKGGTLLKTNDVSQSNMLKGYQVTAFNDYYPVSNFSDYNLNYRYYIRRAEDIVLKINGVYDKPRTTRGVPKRSKGSKFTGRLFDGEI